MLFLMSPAKTLDLTGDAHVMSQPNFEKEAKQLVSTCRKLSKNDLKKMSGVSDAIAAENLERWKQFEKNKAKAACLAFDGPGFRGLNASTFSASERNIAQKSVRILSGLYGVLKPFDGIKPYRLEMGSKIQTPHGKTL